MFVLLSGCAQMLKTWKGVEREIKRLTLDSSLDKDLGLPPRRVVKPEAGTLVLFPSYMWHGTIPFHSQQPRLTVAFDLLPDENQAGRA